MSCYQEKIDLRTDCKLPQRDQLNVQWRSQRSCTAGVCAHGHINLLELKSLKFLGWRLNTQGLQARTGSKCYSWPASLVFRVFLGYLITKKKLSVIWVQGGSWGDYCDCPAEWEKLWQVRQKRRERKQHPVPKCITQKDTEETHNEIHWRCHVKYISSWRCIYRNERKNRSRLASVKKIKGDGRMTGETIPFYFKQ